MSSTRRLYHDPPNQPATTRPEPRTRRSAGLLVRMTKLAAPVVGMGCLGLHAHAQAPASLPVDPGELVHTFLGPNDLGDVVVTLVDTTPTGLMGALPNANFIAPIFWNAGAGADEWSSANLGQVFGVTLDGANPNIYVTAATSEIYPVGSTLGPLGPGGVYRLHGLTGVICHLVTLPNHAVLGPGLGNITYSPRPTLSTSATSRMDCFTASHWVRAPLRQRVPSRWRK